MLPIFPFLYRDNFLQDSNKVSPTSLKMLILLSKFSYFPYWNLNNYSLNLILIMLKKPFLSILSLKISNHLPFFPKHSLSMINLNNLSSKDLEQVKFKDINI